MTSCMPCSFGPVSHPRSEADIQLNGRLAVIVTVRWIPLVPAPSGTRMARPARTIVVQVGDVGTSSATR
jgi:hypothetical protein